jgi:hypothetical protein
MAYASTCLPEVAGRRFCVPASLESATSLHSQETSEGDAGYLADFAHRHIGPC